LKLIQKYRSYDEEVGDLKSKKHYQGSQTWIGLHPQTLQTSYNDIYKILSYLIPRKINKIVDIGAAYGRVGLVAKSLFPQVEFIGFEIVKKRAVEANRIYEKLSLDQCKVYESNVLCQEFKIPNADVYFIYDFSIKEDISYVLAKIIKKKKGHYYLVIKGERAHSLLKHNYQPYFTRVQILKNTELSIYLPKLKNLL
jgi:precorrin-6B methylase 2